MLEFNVILIEHLMIIDKGLIMIIAFLIEILTVSFGHSTVSLSLFIFVDYEN